MDDNGRATIEVKLKDYPLIIRKSKCDLIKINCNCTKGILLPINENDNKLIIG